MKPLLKNTVLSASSAILLFFSFPKYNLEFLAWVGLIPLIFIIRGNNKKNSFFWCWFSGTLFYFITINWITDTMHNYGGMPLWLSFMVLLLLSLYLGIYLGIFGYLTNYISKRLSIPLPFVAPVIWVSLEYAKAHLITGFPWALLGYSQYEFLPIIQIADVTGVYGVSFLIVAVNAALLELLFSGVERGLNKRWKIISISAAAFLFALSLGYGYYRLNGTFDAPGRKFNIAVLQGNIPQHLKWERNFQRKTFDIYKRLTSDAARHNPELVIWPETAAPFFFQDHPVYRNEMFDLASDEHTFILFGNPAYKLTDNQALNMMNSAYLISPFRETLARYDKIHLVPFGEYVPLSKILFFIEKMVAGIGDFIPGNDYTVMEIPRGKFGVVICYEVIFPELVREFILNGAMFMTTITNDAWFGNTSAPYQHFAMVVFRSVENRVYFARAANTGISGFISPKGEILQASPILEESYLVQDISLSDTKTVYTNYGDVFAYAVIFVACVILVITTVQSARLPI